MSQDSNTTEPFEFDPTGDSTVVRFPLSVERANDLLAEFVDAMVPDAAELDEIHIKIEH